MVDNTELSGGKPAGRGAPPVVDPEVAAWHGASKDKNAPRPKVTAEDLEARFTARRAEREARRAGREPRQMGKLVRVVVASAMGVGIAGFALGINSAERQYALDSAANDDKLASLSGALETLSSNDGTDKGQETAGILADGRQRSDELAEDQQRFAVIFHEGNTEPGTNDGRPKPAALKMLEHRRYLAAYFAPESLILTDAEAYTFRTEDLLGPGRIDPRLPWFTRYEPAGEGGAPLASDPQGYSWKTASVTLSGTPDVLNVVWTNTDTNTGDLLAWATARYAAETGTFEDLSVYKTTLGEKQQLKAETTGAAATEGADA